MNYTEGMYLSDTTDLQQLERTTLHWISHLIPDGALHCALYRPRARTIAGTHLAARHVTADEPYTPGTVVMTAWNLAHGDADLSGRGDLILATMNPLGDVRAAPGALDTVSEWIRETHSAEGLCTQMQDFLTEQLCGLLDTPRGAADLQLMPGTADLRTPSQPPVATSLPGNTTASMTARLTPTVNAYPEKMLRGQYLIRRQGSDTITITATLQATLYSINGLTPTTKLKVTEGKHVIGQWDGRTFTWDHRWLQRQRQQAAVTS